MTLTTETKMENRIEGFFIAFSSDELKIVREELIRLGYEPDNDGIKEFFMDSLFEEEREDHADNVIGVAQKFIKDNPESVELGIRVIKNLVGKIGKRR